MSFITRHDSVVIHTQLTQEGKKRLADGQLTISKVAFLDREVDYGFYSGTTSGSSRIAFNTITSLPYRRSGTITQNYDGSDPFILGAGDVYSVTENVSHIVSGIGFYSSITNSNVMADYRIDSSLAIATAYTDTFYSLAGVTSRFGYNPNYYRFNLSGATSAPPDEGLVFIRFNFPYGGSLQPDGENKGFYSNFFRYRYYSGTGIIEVDRVLPRYDFPTLHKQQPMWFYPLSGTSNFYGSGTTTACPVWNMNILIRTPQIGHQPTQHEPKAYLTNGLAAPLDIVTKKYGSKNANGIVGSLGLDDLARCGVIHYTNSFSGSVYGDFMAPKETVVDIPHILWHRNGQGNNGTSHLGGLKLLDAGSSIIYDAVGKTSYTLLMDGVGPSAQVVGRVYFEKKLIIITDQELLVALDPKSNRNWTCPKLNVELVSETDNAIISSSGYTGLAMPGKRYYLTYHMIVYPGDGQRQSIPCGYITSIDGELDGYGNPMYIKSTFPPNSFPFLRNTNASYSGTGVVVETVQLMVQEVDIETDPGPLELSPDLWRVSSGFGVCRYGQNYGVFLPASYVNSLVMYSTYEEYHDSYEYYRLELREGGVIGQTLGFDRAFWPGDTDFFFGNITATAVRRTYTRNVHILLDNNSLNSSFNPTYTSGSTYITEIALLGQDNRILGLGKPDRPLEKAPNSLIDITLKSYY